jgi:cob(I)alamin adenosyltransferase
MSPHDLMLALDTQLAHVWMVRTFLKHSDEAEENEELCEVHRALYDYMLALGSPLKDQNAPEYVKLARKKFNKLRKASETFAAMQPRVSTHTNFQMAAASLNAAVGEIGRLLNPGGSETVSPATVEEDWSE